MKKFSFISNFIFLNLFIAFIPCFGMDKRFQGPDPMLISPGTSPPGRENFRKDPDGDIDMDSQGSLVERRLDFSQLSCGDENVLYDDDECMQIDDDINFMIVLTGIPGVGKTTILEVIKSLYKRNKLCGKWAFFSRDDVIDYGENGKSGFVHWVKLLHDKSYPNEPFPSCDISLIRRGIVSQEEKDKYYNFCNRHWEEIQPGFEKIVIFGLIDKVRQAYDKGCNVVVEHLFTSSKKEFAAWMSFLEKVRSHFVKLYRKESEDSHKPCKKILEFRSDLNEKILIERDEKSGVFETGSSSSLRSFRIRFNQSVNTRYQGEEESAGVILKGVEKRFCVNIFKKDQVDYSAVYNPYSPRGGSDGRSNANLVKTFWGGKF